MPAKRPHWDFPFEMNDRQYFGFLYLIVNNISGRAYIGRKQYRKGGKKSSKSYGQQNAWRQYTSSSATLKEDIATLGKENFSFYALAEYEDRTDLHYWENYLIYTNGCLLSGDWYNNHVNDVYVLPKRLPGRWRKESVKELIERSIGCQNTKRIEAK